MQRLIRAELLKLRTSRAFLVNAVVALVFVPISVATAILTSGKPGASPDLATHEGVRNVLSAASSGSLIMLIIGIMLMAGEFRYGTATSTFLITPNRAAVVGAKLVAAAVAGTAIAFVATALTLAVALPWLDQRHVQVDLFGRDVAVVLAGGLAATILYAFVGVGIGSLVRNQTVAIASALIWVMVVEVLLVSSVPSIGRWLPGGAAAALSAVSVGHGGLLPIWGGGLLFGLYGLAFAAVGTRFAVRRDIT